MEPPKEGRGAASSAAAVVSGDAEQRIGKIEGERHLEFWTTGRVRECYSS